MRRSRSPLDGGVVATGLLALFSLGQTGAAAQGIPQLAEICAGDSDLRAPWCRAGALAYQAAASGLGLSASRGTEIPGTASTLGRRLGTTPRVALSVVLTGTSIPLPEVVDVTDAPVPALRSFVPGLSLGAAAGLLDGFRVAPGVGGMLSVDAVGDLDLLWPSGSDGFSGGRASIGLGARIGIVRESFTVPGVSISVMRRYFNETGLGVVGAPATSTPPPGGPSALARVAAPATPTPVSGGPGMFARVAAQEAPPISLEFDVVATSIRGLVGKDLLTVGLLAGIGWDRYGGDVRLEIEPPAGEGGGAAGNDVSMERWLFFGGASWTSLILQLTGELGWAMGLDDVPDRGTAPFDPGAGSLFGTLSLRLTI